MRSRFERDRVAKYAVRILFRNRSTPKERDVPAHALFGRDTPRPSLVVTWQPKDGAKHKTRPRRQRGQVLSFLPNAKPVVVCSFCAVGLAVRRLTSVKQALLLITMFHPYFKTHAENDRRQNAALWATRYSFRVFSLESCYKAGLLSEQFILRLNFTCGACEFTFTVG